MKTIFWIIFFSLLLNALSAQKYWRTDFRSADLKAEKTKKTDDIKKLSLTLTASLPDTAEKYRAIFTWIAMNISYDVKGLEDYKKVKTGPEDVLASGKSVCEGYANLFDALCEASGLKSQSIAGWTKNSPLKIGKPFEKYTTHAWNAIQINQIWYLCDVTWASGSLSEESGKFEKHFNGYYFCMPERLFFLNHYPEKEKWRTRLAASEKDFINLPFFFGPSLEANIDNVMPSNGIIKFNRGKKIKFSFTVDQPIHNILVKPNTSRIPRQVEYISKKNEISFEYTLDQYAPFLYIFLNNNGAIVYKLEN